jgi:sodium transport system permease protein
VGGAPDPATLEQLLVQPAPPLLLVVAKWAAAASLAVAGTAAAVILGAVVLGRQPLHELGVRLDLGPAVQLRMLLVLLPLALAAAAVQVLVAAGARNYKEAQTYLTLLAFLPAVVAMLAGLDPAFAGGPGGSADALPLLGQLAALRAVLSGNSAGAPVVLSSAACLLMVVVCLLVAAGLLRRERGLNTA